MFVSPRRKSRYCTGTNEKMDRKESLEFNPMYVPPKTLILTPVPEIGFNQILESNDNLRKKFLEMQQTYLDFKKEFTATGANLSPRLFPQGKSPDLISSEIMGQDNIDREIITRLLMPISETADQVQS